MILSAESVLIINPKQLKYILSTAYLEHLSKKLSEMFSMASRVLAGFSAWVKALEHGNWNGIVEIML